MLCWVSGAIMHREALQEKRRDARPQSSLFCHALLLSGIKFILQTLTHTHIRTHADTHTWRSRYSHSIQSLDCPLDCPPPVEPTVDFPSGLARLRVHVRALAQLRPIQSKQTICPLFTQILSPICDVCPALPERRGANRCTGRGAQVTAGHKNAYSSLWLVHKLAAGRLGGLGLGAAPGPELAQLLAAMLSLPQPQPHCAKPLHTYNLLIIHEVFKGVAKKKKKYSATSERRRGRKLTRTRSRSFERESEAKSIYITVEEDGLVESQSISDGD